MALRCGQNSCDPELKRKRLPEMGRFPSQVKDGESIIHLLVNYEIWNFLTRNP